MHPFTGPREPFAPPPIMGAVPYDLGQGPRLPTGVRAYHAPKWKGYGDERRVKALRAFVLHYGGDPRLRAFTVNKILVPSGVQQRDYPKQAAAILAWVQQHCYYTNEPGEQLQSPWVTLEWKTGDCDDLSILVACLAESIRLPWRFVLGGKTRDGRPARWAAPAGQGRGSTSPPRGVDFSHIYVDLGWPPFSEGTGRTEWAAAEATIKGAPLGYDPILHGVMRDGGAVPLGPQDPRGYVVPAGGAAPAGYGPRGPSPFPELAAPHASYGSPWGFSQVAVYGAGTANEAPGNGGGAFPPTNGRLAALLRGFSLRLFTMGVLQSVVTLLLVRWLLSRRRRKWKTA